jgi:hypothetical protein
MIDYVTHYYNKQNSPFLSLSELNEEKAISIMKKLYSEETEYGTRFRNPIQYLMNRKNTEAWVRQEFIKKGGTPKNLFPIYTVLGESQWIDKNGPIDGETGKIRLPLSIFNEGDISFTYPDSMISKWFFEDKPQEYYMDLYHGKVFLKSEIIDLIEQNGIPEYEWKTNLPINLAPYIEGQVWNLQPIINYIKESKIDIVNNSFLN